MNKILNWYRGLSRRVRDSVVASIATVGIISTILSILGVSLRDWIATSFLLRIIVVILAWLAISFFIYYIIGRLFKDSISITIRQTPVSICGGDIFDFDGWKVIGCDTHFDTRIDDIIISKKSLHGQLFMKHGKIGEIEDAVDTEAKRLGLQKESNGVYNFPLGTVIRYDSSVDGQTYLMLAMTEQNAQYEAHTNMAEFEFMLMKMWKEIDRLYASNIILLPVLGDGISRFDDGPKDKETLLRCMLCTLNSSGVSLNSQIKIVVFGDTKNIPLYEYKDIFHVIPGK